MEQRHVSFLDYSLTRKQLYILLSLGVHQIIDLTYSYSLDYADDSFDLLLIPF